MGGFAADPFRKKSVPCNFPIFNSQIPNMKTFVCLILLAMITFSCQKELTYEDIVSGLPTLTTLPVTSVTKNSAYSGGNISDNGGSLITAAGICWSTSHN